MGGSSIVYSASECCLKTTRCFPQNDTLFLPKRYVVFLKMSWCFHQNEPSFYNNRPVVCGKTTGRLMCIKLQLWVGPCRMNMNYDLLRSSQKATAEAAATLRESTWCDIGMRTTRSASAMVCGASPSPSVPIMRASRSCWCKLGSPRGMELSVSAMAAVVNP